MPMIVWTDDMLLHIEKIDTQHQKLVTLLNHFGEAVHRKKSRKVIEDTINALADYTFYHFMTEETYFSQYHYPDSRQHKNEHRYFVQQVAEFQKQLDQGGTIHSEDILLFLKSWVANHIQGIDRKLGLFLHAKGVP